MDREVTVETDVQALNADDQLADHKESDRLRGHCSRATITLASNAPGIASVKPSCSLEEWDSGSCRGVNCHAICRRLRPLAHT